MLSRIPRVSTFVVNRLYPRSRALNRWMTSNSMFKNSGSTDIKNEIVELNVGGLRYAVKYDDLKKHPESFFAAMLKKEWRQHSKNAIKINRDGSEFSYIAGFLMYGHLPRDAFGKLTLDEDTVNKIMVEANFYNLPSLVAECQQEVAVGPVASQHQVYSTIRTFVSSFKDVTGYRYLYSEGKDCKRDYTIECEYPSEEESSALLKSLEQIYSPFCISGKLSSSFDDCKLMDTTSTFSQVNVAELLEMATVSPFGRGTETVVDLNVRSSFEIDMKKFSDGVLNKLQMEIPLEKLSPGNSVFLRPYKLVLYQEGGHFDAHRDTVRDEDHIGTLVVTLNSVYTGGELEVTHHGHTESVTGPYSWVAMYGDCLHQIKPITSGTSVSLIFDIHKGYEGYEVFWERWRRASFSAL